MSSRSHPNRARRSIYLFVVVLTTLITLLCLHELAARFFGHGERPPLQDLLTPLGFGAATLFGLDQMWRADDEGGVTVSGRNDGTGSMETVPAHGPVFIVGNATSRTRLAIGGGALVIDVGTTDGSDAPPVATSRP